MSGMIDENGAGHSGINISESLQEQLHCRENLCKAMKNLAETAPDNLAEEIARLETEFAAAGEVPREFQELLDQQFAEARTAATAQLEVVVRRQQDLTALTAQLANLIAAGELLTLPEIDAFDRACREKLGSYTPVEFVEQLEPFRRKLEAEAKIAQEHAAAVEKLTAELEALTAGEDINPLRDRKTAIEEEFAALGTVPHQVSVKYKEALHKAAQKLAQHFETLDLARWESYTLKMDICTELEKLNEVPEKELPSAARQLQEIREKWKTLGAVPREKHEEINKKFLDTTRLLQHRIDEFYNHRRQERKQAAQDKTQLCEQAEAIQNSTEWNVTSNQFKELQAKWKQIPHSGPGDGELYARFRAAADLFFNARSAYFAERDRKHQEIAAKKNAVIAEAEALQDGDVRRAKQLRDEFRACGNAGRQEVELLGKLNAALDAFFNRRREVFAGRENKCKELIAELAQLQADPLANLARSREIKNELREVSCRSMENAIATAEKTFERQLNLARKAQNQEKGAQYRSLALELAASYDALTKGELTDFTVPVAATLFPKLQSAAELIAQAATGADAQAREKLDRQLRHAAGEYDRICSELEKCAGAETDAAGSLDSLAAELEAAIKGNFAKKEARQAAQKIDPAKLEAELFNAGLLPHKELQAAFARFDAAMARTGKNEQE